MNSGFGFENIVEETKNKMVKYIWKAKPCIKVKPLPNNFKLNMKVFISGTDVENSMK